jgi:L-alanine-DL-glutamate epimerase-like enolase superfamily enzyme
MKITGVKVYQLDLPLHEGSYKWSGGKSVDVFDSTIVKLMIDEGLDGFGEVCPLGPFYLPSYAAGARAGIKELAPMLIGENPLHISKINDKMDAALKGHPYVKSAIDMALWDLKGKCAGMQVFDLLGGKQTDDVVLYRAISQQSPEEMAKKVAQYKSEGYRKFQLKVGGKPNDDIDRIKAVAELMDKDNVLIADANTGWLKHEAMRVVRAVKDVDVYIEQPCLTYEECLDVRRNTDHPFILDESMYSTQEFVRAFSDGAMDVINIKISKFGGLYRASRIRDLCERLGIAMTIEDSWGGDIITAAISHLAQSTPGPLQFSATDFNSYVTVNYAKGAPERVEGKMKASDQSGLGIEVDESMLGEPVFEV